VHVIKQSIREAQESPGMIGLTINRRTNKIQPEMKKSRCRMARLILLAFSLSCVPAVVLVPSCASKRKPNLILISIDTLRADHLGCYGYGRDITPHLDGLARESALFINSFSASNYTLPSHASMLTSLDAYSHRMTQSLNVLPSGAATIAEVLKREGYVTGGFTGDTWVSKIFGFNRGFDFWRENRYIRQLLPPLKKWLLKNGSEPFFVFLHFYDVHTPYVFRPRYMETYHQPGYAEEVKQFNAAGADEKKKRFSKDEDVFLSMAVDLTIKPTLMRFSPKKEVEQLKEAAQTYSSQRDSVQQRALRWKGVEGFDSQLQFIVDSYDAGIQYADWYLDNFFNFLKDNGLWNDTLVIVTSDHGEELMDHDLVVHFNYGYDTLIRVPLIMKFPRGKGLQPAKYLEPAEGVDLMPTILDLLDIDYEGPVQGESLLDAEPGGATVPERCVFATTGDLKKHVIRSPAYKYIAKLDDAEGASLADYKFYDLRKDPGELNNIIEQAQSDENYLPVLRKLKGDLKAHMEQCGSIFQKLYPGGRKSSAIDDERMKNFKALGYIE
jgi:choline-sulfatase